MSGRFTGKWYGVVMKHITTGSKVHHQYFCLHNQYLSCERCPALQFAQRLSHFLLQVLDVGIGTAFALCRNAHEVKAKNLFFVGIDIDEHYIKGARQNCIECGTQSYIT